VLVYCTVHNVNTLKKKTLGNKAKLHRAVFLVSSVVLVFSVCFLPCIIARIELLIVRIKDQHNAETIAVQIYGVLMVLSYSDCLLDQLVYCFCYSGFTDVYMSNSCPYLLSYRRSNGSTVTDEQKLTSPPLRDKVWFYSRSTVLYSQLHMIAKNLYRQVCLMLILNSFS
jgi:hypothetical protein